MNNTLTREEIQLIAFTIILHSGNARTLIHQAFKNMREADFNRANEQLENANDELLKAHHAQTELLQSYANGSKFDMEIIMVHAQDHLMTTMTLREVSIEMVHLYQQNNDIQKLLKEASK